MCSNTAAVTSVWPVSPTTANTVDACTSFPAAASSLDSLSESGGALKCLCVLVSPGMA